MGTLLRTWSYILYVGIVLGGGEGRGEGGEGRGRIGRRGEGGDTLKCGCTTHNLARGHMPPAPRAPKVLYL